MSDLSMPIMAGTISELDANFKNDEKISSDNMVLEFGGQQAFCRRPASTKERGLIISQYRYYINQAFPKINGFLAVFSPKLTVVFIECHVHDLLYYSERHLFLVHDSV